MHHDFHYLITKFLNGETLVLDLIKHYGDQTFFDDLMKEANDSLIRNFHNHNISNEDRGLIIVALTMISMYYYDGNLWDYIRKYFEDFYNIDNNDQKLDQKIREIIRPYKTVYNYYDPNSFVAVPIIAAGVCHCRMFDFFDFSYAIYKENLLARREIDDEELETEMYNAFKSLSKSSTKYSMDDENILIRTGSHKTYRLSKYTQSALSTGTNCEGLAIIAAYCAKCIIKYRNNEPFFIKKFYEEGFETWKENYELKYKEKDKDIFGESKQWKVALKYKDGEFILYTRTQNISDDYDPSSINMHIFENGECIKIISNDELEISQAIGTYLIGYKKIKIDANVMNEISYQFVSNGNVIPGTLNIVYKNIGPVFFDQYGEYLKPGKDYAGPVIIVSKHSINKYSRNCSTYFITESSIDESKQILVDDSYYYFKSKIKTELNGQICDDVKIVSPDLTEEYPLYTSINSIVFQSQMAPQNLHLVIDRKAINDAKLIVLNEDTDYLNTYSIDLKEFSSGYHILEICDGDLKPVAGLTFKFIYDKNYHFSSMCEHNLLKIKINSSFINTEKVCPIDDIEETFDCYIDGLGISKIISKVNLVRISPDLKNWYVNGDFIKYKEIRSNKLYIIGGVEETCDIISDNDRYKVQIMKTDKKDVYYIDTLVIYRKKGNNDKGFNVIIKNKFCTNRFVIDYYSRINMNKSFFVYDMEKDEHNFNVCYDSEEQLIVKIVEHNKSHREICKFFIQSNVTFHPNSKELKGYQNYDILLEERDVSKGLFSNFVVIKIIPYYFHKHIDMIGRVFNIDYVYYRSRYFQLVKEKIHMKTTLKIIGQNRDDPNCFVGTLKRWNGKEDELKKLGLVSINDDFELNSNFPKILINDLDGELLFFNLESKKIHDTTDINKYTRNFPGIEQYVLSVVKES